MKNNFKTIFIICSLILLIFIIKSRTYSKTSFDLVVLTRMENVREKCNELGNKILKYKTDSINGRIESVKSNEEINAEYNYRYGDCSLDDKTLKKRIEQDFKKELNENWKFLY